MLETERLLFRPYDRDDIGSYVSLVADSRVMQYIGDGKVRTREEANHRIQCLIDRFDGTTCTGLMVLEEKSSRRAIGHAGLVPQTVDGQNELEIGYWIAPEFWGQGLATEAALMLRNHGLQVLRRPRLISLIQHGNAASVKVAQKIGLNYELDPAQPAARQARGWRLSHSGTIDVMVSL